jgi:hypothetical protein
MRGLKRNKKVLYYQLYDSHLLVYETDLDGNIIYDPETGEPLLTGDDMVGYAEPVKFRANVSPARGDSDSDPFGISLDYTKQIVTCDMALPIVEGTLIWESEPVEDTGKADYKVVAVAKSLNSIIYAMKKIESGNACKNN